MEGSGLFVIFHSDLVYKPVRKLQGEIGQWVSVWWQYTSTSPLNDGILLLPLLLSSRVSLDEKREFAVLWSLSNIVLTVEKPVAISPPIMF